MGSDDCAQPDDQSPLAVPRTNRIYRLLIRFTVLAALVTLLTGFAAPWPWTPVIVPALSPYVLICSGLAGRWFAAEMFAGESAWWSVSVSRAFLVGLPVLLFVAVSHRGFCRYACPVGLATEPLRRLRPSARRRFAAIPHLGRWIVLATWAGAALGFPLAIWLDPLAIFSGVFGLQSSIASAAGWAAATGLLLIAVSAALWPNAWCLRVCPLGATQELVSLGIRTTARIGKVRRPANSSQGSQTPQVSRRTVLSLGMGALAAIGGTGVAKWARSSAAELDTRPLRPPGAAGEGRFPWLCIRCGNCIRTCPEQILRPDLAPGTVFGYLAPLVEFGESYCKEDCARCTDVCPSGAIAPLSPDAKKTRPIGVAQVNMAWCLLSPDNGERECAICRKVCPYDAIKLEFDWNTYVTSPVVDPHKCPGCGACEVACPGTNEVERAAPTVSVPLQKAIFVVPRGGQSNGTKKPPVQSSTIG